MATLQDATQDLTTAARPPDIVVDVSADEILVIGGNVGDSVTRRPLALDDGFLTVRQLGGETLFAIMQNRVPLLGASA